MSTLSPRQVNVEILRALKIDPARVRKVVITLEVDHMPTVEVTRLADGRDADGLATAVEMLHLQAAPVQTVDALPEPRTTVVTVRGDASEHTLKAVAAAFVRKQP